jgi:hypothetical protein
LNSAIAVTLRAMFFEGLSQEEAVGQVITYVDGLTNAELSSRLANNRTDIYRVIRATANRIWQDNGGQVDNDTSSKKWQAIIQRWRAIGFLVSDKTTWDHGAVVDCEDFEFSEDEKRLIIEEMAPVLVGKKQAVNGAKQREVIKAVRYFLRYVKCHDREIARDGLPTILRDFDLKLGMDIKRQAFLDLLRKWGWIYVRAEYWHPKQQGKEGKGRARAYGIGPAMAGKVSNPSSFNTHNNIGSILLCSTFSKSLPDEVKVPCFQDYFDRHNGEFRAENLEVVLESGCLLAEQGTS